MSDTPTNDIDSVGEALTGEDQQMVAHAHRHGVRDVNELTSLVFYARHPEMSGREILSDETALAQEWIDVRDTVVRPALDRLASESVQR